MSTASRTGLTALRRTLFWALPVLLISYILYNIDIGELQRNIARTNPWLALLGLALFPLATMAGALRWSALLGPYNRRPIPLSFGIKHYWIGLATGYFTPGSIGADLYRIVVVGRKFGNYIINAVVIIIEKLLALFVCMSIIIVLYPVVAPASSSPLMEEILFAANILLGITIAVFIAAILARHTSVFDRLVTFLEGFLNNAFQTILARVRIPGSTGKATLPLQEALEPIFHSRRFAIVVLLSFSIQIISACASQVFFSAAGYEIDFLVNLFLGPIFFLILLLPISFGGIGVREASFIVLYGLFDVPSETALLVGFFCMMGGLLSIAIGAMMIAAGQSDYTEASQEIPPES